MLKISMFGTNRAGLEKAAQATVSGHGGEGVNERSIGPAIVYAKNVFGLRLRPGEDKQIGWETLVVKPTVAEIKDSVGGLERWGMPKAQTMYTGWFMGYVKSELERVAQKHLLAEHFNAIGRTEVEALDDETE